MKARLAIVLRARGGARAGRTRRPADAPRQRRSAGGRRSAREVLQRARADEADRRRERHARDAKRELAIGEQLLRDGAYTNAAVALYAIVKSPRYAAFTDFVEFENAEYDLAVALARSGAYGAALDVDRRDPARAARRRRTGARRTAAPSTSRSRPATTPACSRASRRSRRPIRSRRAPPASATYLRGRAAYEAGKLADAEGELVLISKKSRLYSSAVYLRGVIRARRGEYKDAAEAMCEIAGDRRQRQDHVRRRRSLLHDQGPRAARPRPDRARGGRVRRRLLPLLPDPRRLGVPARRAVRGELVDVPEARARDVARPRARVPEHVPELAAVARGEPARRLRRARRLQVRRLAEVVRRR